MLLPVLAIVPLVPPDAVVAPPAPPALAPPEPVFVAVDAEPDSVDALELLPPEASSLEHP
jgi:hypothetical protein